MGIDECNSVVPQIIQQEESAILFTKKNKDI